MTEAQVGRSPHGDGGYVDLRLEQLSDDWLRIDFGDESRAWLQERPRSTPDGETCFPFVRHDVRADVVVLCRRADPETWTCSGDIPLAHSSDGESGNTCFAERGGEGVQRDVSTGHAEWRWELGVEGSRATLTVVEPRVPESLADLVGERSLTDLFERFSRTRQPR